MKNETLLYEDESHKCVMFSLEDEEHKEHSLSVNQFLIIQHESAILIDPGSGGIFGELYDAVARHIDPGKIKFIFFSHQDPDVAGAIAEWSVATSAKLIMSQLWTRFMGHYGLMDMGRIIALEDHGARIKFEHDFLQFIPAHFLHSPGNFSLYDSRSKILFSGDIGAAVLSPQNLNKNVDDFEEHRPFLESFHGRYMAANHFCRAWVKCVRKYEVAMIAPQHGSLFKEEMAHHFLEWFEKVEGGYEHCEELYGC
ncbi:MAG: MBL fold metallo-hydrolase [Sulfuricurvum sp.]|uniref:MBL fold metallo-hydrolase n=1 Tax=Sulfuricurvum sp. TaxID=2025608 RepID=UPI0026316F2C|nr:MBL fold metallo-hydrolase [Sulfuricurvum sp.]MDD2368366.1 MBL fold metallo-hydrolase [Sulfuricurvum sp.]MDD2950251.1 MBL fold metallo-hydrolase [Sulfuricurvum sp.]MDD5118943.1 MBL fold metallo-hydrolase [Sulfuricurvum sp.]